MTKGRWIATAVIAAGLMAAPAAARADEGCRRHSSYSRSGRYDSSYYGRSPYYETVYDNSYYAPAYYYDGYAPYGYGYAPYGSVTYYRNYRSTRYVPYRYDRYGRSRGPAGYYRQPVRRGGLTVHIGW